MSYEGRGREGGGGLDQVQDQKYPGVGISVHYLNRSMSE